MFVYSGCDGNLNNFEQEEDCNLRCICSRPKDVGIGKGNTTRFFYNEDTNKCEGFTYSGAEGNSNRFLRSNGCEDTCAPPKAKCRARPDFGKICDRKPSATYYYYDSNSGVCTNFTYLGCQGSKNKFSTQERCQTACIGKNFTTTPSPKPNVCLLQPVPGPCTEQLIRYYFDHSIKRCLPFVYSGCGSNGNMFENMTTCSDTCHMNDGANTTSTVPPTTTPMVTTTTKAPKPAFCNYDAVRGECGFNLKRYHFDRVSGTCKEFFWTGCGGNMNRFMSREVCFITCVGNM